MFVSSTLKPLEAKMSFGLRCLLKKKLRLNSNNDYRRHCYIIRKLVLAIWFDENCYSSTKRRNWAICFVYLRNPHHITSIHNKSFTVELHVLFENPFLNQQTPLRAERALLSLYQEATFEADARAPFLKAIDWVIESFSGYVCLNGD